MQQYEQLICGNYYHIYNRGINSCNLFYTSANYAHFLCLYEKYISPVADTFAWVLMPNHFHFLVKIKSDIVYRYSKTDESIDEAWFEDHKWETTDLSACEAPDSVKIPGSIKISDSIKIPKPHLHFSHLFNSFGKYINDHYDRHGSLFERPFKRKLIDNETYLKNIVLYIHHNPVHHGFCEHPVEYPWSSFLTCISEEPTKLQRDKVIEWFRGNENFLLMHNINFETRPIEDLLKI